MNRYALSDDVQMYPQMLKAEIISNFGGQARLEYLRHFFNHLRELNVTLFVLSHGRKKAVEFFLRKVALLQVSGYYVFTNKK